APPAGRVSRAGDDVRVAHGRTGWRGRRPYGAATTTATTAAAAARGRRRGAGTDVDVELCGSVHGPERPCVAGWEGDGRNRMVEPVAPHAYKGLDNGVHVAASHRLVARIDDVLIVRDQVLLQSETGHWVIAVHLGRRHDVVIGDERRLYRNPAGD